MSDSKKPCPNPYCDEGHVYGIDMGDVNLGHGPCERCYGKGYLLPDGQQIREWRWAIGLTQVAMGRKLGCTGRQVRRYELGDTPTPKLVYDAVEKLYEEKLCISQ